MTAKSDASKAAAYLGSLSKGKPKRLSDAEQTGEGHAPPDPKLLPIPLVIYCLGQSGITKREVSYEVWGPMFGYKISDFLT